MADSLHVDLTGSASGFVSAVDAATHSLGSLQKRVESMGFVSRTLKELVTPATTAIASAFAASKALGAFAESNLPGAKKYSDAVEKARTAVTGLAAAVGEYLAPQAIKLANFITSVAEKLTPWVRKFTAFTESAGAFLAKLGSNAADAFRAIMPALDGIINYISGLFKGPAHDWMADVEVFRNWWNDTWDSILNYTAPLIVAAASAIDQALSTIGEMATAAFNAARAAIEPFLEGMQGGEVMVGGLAEAIQVVLVTAIGAAEFAITNWRDTFALVRDAIVDYVSQIGDNIRVLWDNAVVGMQYFGEQTKSLFTELFGANGYIVKLLQQLFVEYLPKLAVSALQYIGGKVRHYGSGQLLADTSQLVTAPKFKNPAFNFKPGELPDFAPLPGVHQFNSPAKDSFFSGMADFLNTRLPKVGDTASMFIDAVKFMLPDVTAKPNDYIVGNPITRDQESTKHTGLAMEGSVEAYKAILAMQDRSKQDSLDVAKAQLNEQKKTNDKLGAIGGLAAGAIP